MLHSLVVSLLEYQTCGGQFKFPPAQKICFKISASPRKLGYDEYTVGG